VRIVNLAGAAVLATTLAACASTTTVTKTVTASPTTPNAIASVEAAASACAASGGTWDGSTCGPPTQTDPNGVQCTALDSQGYCPNDLSTPPPTTQAPDTVTYVVTGSGPADVTYGPAGSNFTGGVPMRVTKDIPSQPPAYYAIDAQLQGGGSVSCKILVDGKVTSSASAQGGYNIASCEISQDPLSGGWTDTNSS
jgi:hypothetical protein